MHAPLDRRYGWNPDYPDPRDRLQLAPPQALAAAPPRIDLRPGCPPVCDQGQLGSCTGNMLAGLAAYRELAQGLPFTPKSRLFIYYNERMLEGTTSYDAGASIRDGIKTLAAYGVCPESEWPYDPSQFAVMPGPRCYADAKKYVELQYARVPQELSQLRAALAGGWPIGFGFTVYASFESPQVAATGVVPMPRHGEPILGGHAVMLVGYEDASQNFIVRNSWGAAWGQQGYFLMPYAYVVNARMANDFWVIQKMSA